jgi:outer membrane protein assembly factor BamD
MIYLRNRLADFEINVAHHYEERGAWVAAAQRARQTIEQYDGAPAVKEALRVLVRCYRRLDYKELEANTVKVFRENFPEDSLEISRTAGKPWWKFWGT